MNNIEPIMKVRNTDYLEWQNKIQQLKKENESLKSQLSNIKTLDRGEVLTSYDEFIEKVFNNFKEEILEGYQSFKINQEYQIISDNFITTICNLVFPEQKTLDRRSVWKLIEKHRIRIVDDKGFVEDICNLALEKTGEAK